MSGKPVSLFVFILMGVILCGFGAGCGGGGKPSGFLTGTVYFGGEPASEIPVPGVSSMGRFFTPSNPATLNIDIPDNPASLIVQCDPKFSELEQQQLLSELGFEIVRRLYGAPDTYVVRPNHSNDLESAYQIARQANFITSVEYNYPISKKATTPNDVFYENQWDMVVTKFNVIWDDYKGQSPVIVAVLDTGINVASPELSGRMAPATAWYDFIDNDQDPREPGPTTGMLRYSHGTNVAGIIGAKPNNTIGYAGAAWDESKIKILPVRVLNTDGIGDISGIIDGIYWAVLHQAKVINLSLGIGASYNSVFFNNAVAYAESKGVTIVCAAGNENTAVGYPARLSRVYSNVIAVGATGYTNSKAWYSCFGPELTVMAPGGDNSVENLIQKYIWNITFDKSTQSEVYDEPFMGTSQATPHVSALAALLYSYGMTDPFEIRKVIGETATDLGANGPDTLYGFGLINAFATMIRATQTGSSTIASVTLRLRNPITKEEVTAPVHPDSSGYFQFPVLPPGKYELYGFYDLPSEFKYERIFPVEISGSRSLNLALYLYPD